MLVFIAGTSYGFIVPVIKTANVSDIFPSQFLPMQYLIAFVACLIYMFVRKVEWGSVRRIAPLMIPGVFTGLTSICYYSAVTLLPSSAALTLLFQYVWVSVLIECVHKRKLPSLTSVIAICIVLSGTVLATGVLDGNIGNLNPVGVGFGAGSAVFYALFLYVSGIIGAHESTPLRATMLTLGGLITTSVCNPLVYITSFASPAAWEFSAMLAVLGILFPTTLINFAGPKLSAGMVSIMASTELPVGILAAWVFVGDTPTPLVLLGAALVFVGIFCKQIPDVVRTRKA